jgi:site-specific DNA-methyltransferase (cytosine-N4-specific)
MEASGLTRRSGFHRFQQEDDEVRVLAKIARNVDFVVKAGDAFDLVETIPAASVDTILTSPPYWGLRSYDLQHNWEILTEWRESGDDSRTPPPYDWYRLHGGILGLEPFPEWYIAHLVEILDKAGNTLKSSGSLWVNLGDTYFARWSSIRENGRQGLGDQTRERRRTPMGGYRQEKQLLLVPSRFAIAMQERRWILRNDIIWYKPNIPPRPHGPTLPRGHTFSTSTPVAFGIQIPFL